MNSYSYRNDPYFLRNGFETSGRFNFPVIKRQSIELDSVSLIPYHLTKPDDVKNKNCGVHYFLDDYRFNECYDFPEKAFSRICNYLFTFTPDYSLYREMPIWRLIENVGKSRWCGAYWQSKGKTVIPTISWSGLSNIDICTAGIEKGCVIAVSTIGCRNSKFDFLLGYENVIKILEPAKIICVGKPFEEIKNEVIHVPYSRNSKILTNKDVYANLELSRSYEPMLPFEEFFL